MPIRLSVFAIAILSVWSISAPALSQTPPAPPVVPVINVGQDGFFLQSSNADYRLQFGLLLQADERFAVDDVQNNVINTFNFRRIRPILQGRVARFFDFYFNPDFAGAIVNIRDAYVDTRFSSAFRLRVGKMKSPFGLERLHSASSLLFVERSVPTSVAPDRDTGLEVLGDLQGGLLTYAAGVFNGVADGGSSEGDTNDGKDLVGRVVVKPFVRKTTSALAGLGIAAAGSVGVQPLQLPSFVTSGRQTFFHYDTLATGDGTRTRVSPQWFYYYKSVGVFGEYVRSVGDVAKTGLSTSIAHQAFVVAGSFVVTGEAATEKGVRPRNSFDPENHKWGALQLVARYHGLDVDEEAITLGLAAAGASRQARAFTAGANWYLNPNIKWVFNFERTVFDGDPHGPRHPENLILVRAQMNF